MNYLGNFVAALFGATKTDPLGVGHLLKNSAPPPPPRMSCHQRRRRAEVAWRKSKKRVRR
jgi:hypothetical protein